uniref:Uncharacterized protein n=1 Tax=Rhizophora mucronata TaxID=61149 RepID=A0A2P2JSK1_RHIMU
MRSLQKSLEPKTEQGKHSDLLHCPSFPFKVLTH